MNFKFLLFIIFFTCNNLLCMDNQLSEIQDEQIVIQRNKKCNICLIARRTIPFITLNCGHSFCKICLDTSLVLDYYLKYKNVAHTECHLKCLDVLRYSQLLHCLKEY